MCGFLTFFSKEVIDKEKIDALNEIKETMKYRGPDSSKYFAGENIYMGFNRLSIIDFNSGSQPMTYHNNNYTIVFNGEIYNYKELRESLIQLGYDFNTNSEAEVLLACYCHYGSSFVKLLRGMFAFVIWNGVTQSIFGARDTFGIKPFYYLEKEEGLYCSSEVKCLKLCLEKTDINFKGLHNYFTFQYVPEPETIFCRINILPPGHTIKKSLNGNIEIEKYASIILNPSAGNEDIKIKNIVNALMDSVETHMVSDAPVATFLSGGIDSTIIASLAREINPDIKSFTVGFEREGYSEIDLAKETADALEIENINKTITIEEFINELPNIVSYMDVPLADPSAIPLYFISKEASNHVKVALSGEGSDELFGGYNIYNEPNSLQMFNYIPNFIKNILLSLSRIMPEGIKGKSFIERGVTPLEQRFIGNAKVFKEKEKIKLIHNYDPSYNFIDITAPLYKEVSHLDEVSKMQYIDLNTWLRGDILAKADKMSMANSLEVRVPFLDYKVLKAASILGVDDKVKNNTTKYLLRQAFKEKIPPSAVNRKKIGFPVPIRLWLKNEMYTWARDIINTKCPEEYINKAFALELLEKHRKGYVDYSRRIWSILIFILWYEIHSENDVRAYIPEPVHNHELPMAIKALI